MNNDTFVGTLLRAENYYTVKFKQLGEDFRARSGDGADKKDVVVFVMKSIGYIIAGIVLKGVAEDLARNPLQ